MNLYKKYTQDIGIIATANLVISLRSLILLPIITKTLGASGYGIWTQAMVTLSLIAPISDLNLSASLARFLTAQKDKREIQEGFFSVIITVLGWSTLIAIVMLLLANNITEALFHDPRELQITYIVAAIVPLWAMEIVCLGFFRAFREMKTYSILRISRNLFELALIAGLVLSGHGIFSAILSLLISRIVMTAVMLYMITSRIRVRFPKFLRLKSYLSFGLPMIPGMLSSWVTSSSDRYVISFFIGIASVGIYSAGYTIGHVLSFFAAPLALVLLPTLSKLYDENQMNMVRTHLTYSVKYFLMLAIPSVFGLSVLANSLLKIFTAPEFVATGSIVVPIVAVSYLFFGVYVVFSQVFILIKKTRIIGILWAVAALLNLGLNIIFVPRFGVLAAAVTTLVTYTLVVTITVILSTRYLRFETDRVFILKSIAAALVMSLIIWKLNPTGITHVLGVMGLGAVIYFGFLFLVKSFSQNEIRFFMQLFKIG